MVLDSIRWRVDFLRRKIFLYRNFRNGSELYTSWLRGTPCDEAVFKNGLVIQHPHGNPGLAGMILEIWHRKVYTGSFYTPQPNDLIVDGGANIGVFSVHVSQLCATAKVVAMEPFQENFAYLRRNLETARATAVDARPIALGNRTGFAKMKVVGNRSQDHQVVNPNSPADTIACNPTQDPDTIQTICFLDLMKEIGSREVALFKCDIEGSEVDLLGDAQPEQLLQIKRLAIEYHDNIRPGASAMLIQTLSATHDTFLRDVSPLGYGMLYGVRKDLR
jgi:FkbM family methyltransferase